jgi:galactokinase
MRDDSSGAVCAPRDSAAAQQPLQSATQVTDRARQRFRARFTTEPRVFRAPARINLIGEHTDYNDGLVLPMAIDHATAVAAAPRADRQVHAVSASEEVEVRIDLDSPGTPRSGAWGDYVEGVVRTLRTRGRRLAGADLYVCSSIPAGAGLSSSAALEVGVGRALLAISGEAMGKLELAAACQAAEHEWVGTRCGIMDQLAVLCAEPGRALAIDCRDLRMQLVPFVLEDMALLVTDSTVAHRLASSAYNARRRECEAAAEALRRFSPGILALRDVSPSDLARWQASLPEPLAARARHVVGEIARVELAVACLRVGDWDGLGQLMYASHASLRDDFRVSTVELDLLVDTAAGTSGVLGARMTGGGFGGCVISLVRRAALPLLEERLERALFDGFGLRPRSFETRAAAGAGEVIAHEGAGVQA